MAGTTRVLASVVSGRDFLQTIVEDVAAVWERSTYFEALKSKRRLDLLREINEFVSRVTMRAVLPDRLAGVADKKLLFEPCGHRITVGQGMEGVQSLL
jgi:hypothetical protein